MIYFAARAVGSKTGGFSLAVMAFASVVPAGCRTFLIGKPVSRPYFMAAGFADGRSGVSRYRRNRSGTPFCRRREYFPIDKFPVTARRKMARGRRMESPLFSWGGETDSVYGLFCPAD